MNRLFTVVILCLCAVSVYSATTKNVDDELAVVDQSDLSTIQRVFKKIFKWGDEVQKESTNATRSKRQAYGAPSQLPQRPAYAPQVPPQYPPQGYGQQLPPPRLGNQIVDGGLGAEFPDFYDFYPNDFLYDYYDWVCSDTSCQLCNILTSECCDPDVNVNCFLPDSCLNNPCLSGGTCIPTRTIDDRPDFICACYPGFTGKYCQLTNEFFFPPPPPPPPPAPMQRPQVYPPQPSYPQQPPQPSYPQLPQQPSYNNNNNNNQARLPAPGPAVPPFPLPAGGPQPRLPVGNVPTVSQPRLPPNNVVLQQPRI